MFSFSKSIKTTNVQAPSETKRPDMKRHDQHLADKCRAGLAFWQESFGSALTTTVEILKGKLAEHMTVTEPDLEILQHVMGNGGSTISKEQFEMFLHKFGPFTGCLKLAGRHLYRFGVRERHSQPPNRVWTAFHGTISDETANQKLMSFKRNPCYLVRNHPNPVFDDQMILDYNNKGSIKSYTIIFDSANGCRLAIDSSEWFQDLAALALRVARTASYVSSRCVFTQTSSVKNPQKETSPNFSLKAWKSVLNSRERLQLLSRSDAKDNEDLEQQLLEFDEKLLSEATGVSYKRTVRTRCGLRIPVVSALIGEVKAEIEARVGIPIDQQCIVYGSKVGTDEVHVDTLFGAGTKHIDDEVSVFSSSCATVTFNRDQTPVVIDCEAHLSIKRLKRLIGEMLAGGQSRQFSSRLRRKLASDAVPVSDINILWNDAFCLDTNTVGYYKMFMGYSPRVFVKNSERRVTRTFGSKAEPALTVASRFSLDVRCLGKVIQVAVAPVTSIGQLKGILADILEIKGDSEFYLSTTGGEELTDGQTFESFPHVTAVLLHMRDQAPASNEMASLANKLDSFVGSFTECRFAFDLFDFSKFTLSNFEVDEKSPIGSGSNGQVFRCSIKGTKHVYALKKLWDNGCGNKVPEEIRIPSEYPHESVCRVVHQFEDRTIHREEAEKFGTGKTSYFVMDMYKETLFDVVSRSRLSERQALLILLQILKAVAHLYRNQIVHRDLKLTDICLDNDGFVYVIDFGCATRNILVKDGLGHMKNFPPEVLIALTNELMKPNWKMADCWAVGCLCYEICGAPHPFPKGVPADNPPFPAGYPNVASLATELLNRDPVTRTRPDAASRFVENTLWPIQNDSPEARMRQLVSYGKQLLTKNRWGTFARPEDKLQLQFLLRECVPFVKEQIQNASVGLNPRRSFHELLSMCSRMGLPRQAVVDKSKVFSGEGHAVCDLNMILDRIWSMDPRILNAYQEQESKQTVEEIPLSELESVFHSEGAVASSHYCVVFKGRFRKQQTAVYKVIVSSRQEEDLKFARKMIRLEADVLALVKDIPLPKPFAVVKDQNGVCGIIMEEIQGESLHLRLLNPNVSVKKRLDYCLQIARIMRTLHNRDPSALVHRDLKPSNLMVRRDGVVVLLDFGMARFHNEDGLVDSSHNSAGTDRYRAPEQSKGCEISYKVDVYAFGIMLPEIVTGLKWDEHTFPRAQLNERVAQQLQLLGLRCIQHLPDNRPDFDEITDKIQALTVEPPIQV